MNRWMLTIVAALVLLALPGPAEAAYIVAWGSNYYGALDVPEGDDFVAIAAGPMHNLAIREDGSLVAWGGANLAGELDVPAGNDFVAIATSSRTSYALRSDGSIAAWGRAWVYAPRGNDFVAVAAFTSAAIDEMGMALRKDGSLLGFGFNCDNPNSCHVPEGDDFVAISRNAGLAALRADGSLVDIRSIDPPAGNDFVAVAAGTGFGLALREGGSLAAWGYGPGVTDLPTGHDFVAIDAGSRFALAIREDGSLAAWGYNTYDQLDVPQGKKYTAVSAGFSHALAIEVPEPSVLAGLLAAAAGGLVLAYRCRRASKRSKAQGHFRSL